MIFIDKKVPFGENSIFYFDKQRLIRIFVLELLSLEMKTIVIW